MNEFIFFFQTFLVIVFALGALKIGRDCLIAWIAIQALIANIFVVKQISLFGFDVTASDVFAIGSLLALNLLQEFYTKKDAIRATWICFFFMLFFALISQLHLFYEPNEFDTTHPGFVSILSLSPRLFTASMGVFFLVQQIDIRFFSFLKEKLNRTSFPMRAGISLVISELLDTILFSFAGLYGVVNSVFEIILFSFIIKLIVIFCFSSFMRLVKT